MVKKTENKAAETEQVQEHAGTETTAQEGALAAGTLNVDDAQKLAQAGYEAYCESTEWKSAVTGAALPPFSETSAAVQTAWRAAAQGMISAYKAIT